MKLIKLFSILMSMSLIFISCSKDDDKDSNETSTGAQKQLKSIDYDHREYILSFIYTNGKISREVESYYDSYYGETRYYNKNITYLDSKIETQDDSETITYNLTNGLVTRIIYDTYYEDITYENGRIKTWKNYHNGKLFTDILFEWKDDVIVHEKITYVTYGDEEDYYYTYTDYIDYGGIVASFQSDGFFYDDLPESLILQGYFGKLPKYLVSEINDVMPGGIGRNNFSYVMDKDGYPTTMTWTLQDGRSFPTYYTWE